MAIREAKFSLNKMKKPASAFVGHGASQLKHIFELTDQFPILCMKE